MKRKVLATVLSMMMLSLTVAGCGKKAEEPTAPAPAENQEQDAQPAPEAEGGSEEKTGKDAKDIKVAGVVFQEDQFMKLMQLGYQAAADDYGVQCMLANTNNDQAKEAELISTYTTQKLDGIAISPLNEETSIQTLKAAYDSGLQIAVGNTKLADAPFVCGGYTSDNYNIGELTSQEVYRGEPGRQGKNRHYPVPVPASRPVLSQKERIHGSAGRPGYRGCGRPGCMDAGYGSADRRRYPDG